MTHFSLTSACSSAFVTQKTTKDFLRESCQCCADSQTVNEPHTLDITQSERTACHIRTVSRLVWWFNTLPNSFLHASSLDLEPFLQFRWYHGRVGKIQGALPHTRPHFIIASVFNIFPIDNAAVGFQGVLGMKMHIANSQFIRQPFVKTKNSTIPHSTESQITWRPEVSRAHKKLALQTN